MLRTVSETEVSCSVFSALGLQLTMCINVWFWDTDLNPSPPIAQTWKEGSKVGDVCGPLNKCQTESIHALPVCLLGKVSIPYHAIYK